MKCLFYSAENLPNIEVCPNEATHFVAIGQVDNTMSAEVFCEEHYFEQMQFWMEGNDTDEICLAHGRIRTHLGQPA